MAYILVIFLSFVVYASPPAFEITLDKKAADWRKKNGLDPDNVRDIAGDEKEILALKIKAVDALKRALDSPYNMTPDALYFLQELAYRGVRDKDTLLLLAFALVRLGERPEEARFTQEILDWISARWPGPIEKTLREKFKEGKHNFSMQEVQDLASSYLPFDPYKVEANGRELVITFARTLVDQPYDIAKYVHIPGVKILRGYVVYPNKIVVICEGYFKVEKPYEVTIKKGIESYVSGRQVAHSQKDKTLTMVAQDMKPQVGFVHKEKYFLLSHKRPYALPMMAVNQKRVHVKIFAVGDDLGVQARVKGPGAIWWDIEQKGGCLWEGVVDLSGEGNTIQGRSFPFAEMLGEACKPGCYFVRFAPPGGSVVEKQFVVVSDIGVTTYDGDDGVHVFAYSLASGKALSDHTVSVCNKTGYVLDDVRTDGRGYAHVPKDFLCGKGGWSPETLIVSCPKGRDKAVMPMSRGYVVHQSGGDYRAHAQKNVYVFTDKHLYKPGEPIHVTAMVRGRNLQARSCPLTFVLRQPNGRVFRKILEKKSTQGVVSVEFSLPKMVSEGAWRIEVFEDPKGPVCGKTDIRTGQRLRPDMRGAITTTIKQKAVHGRVVVQDTYDFTVPGVLVSTNAYLKPGKLGDAWEGYVFGALERQELTSYKKKTDRQGEVHWSIPHPQGYKQHGLLSVEISGHLSNEQGNVVPMLPSTTPMWLNTRAVGLKMAKNQDGGAFLCVVLNAKQKPQKARVRYTVFVGVDTYYWAHTQGSWSYKKEGLPANPEFYADIETKDDGPTLVHIPQIVLEKGRLCKIEAKDLDSGAVTVLHFPEERAPHVDTANALYITKDPKDASLLSVKAASDGHIRLFSVHEGLQEIVSQKVMADKDIRFPLSKILDKLTPPGGYVFGVLNRPLSASTGKATAWWAPPEPLSFMGCFWLDAPSSKHVVHPRITVPHTMNPGARVDVEVMVDRRPDEDMYVKVFAVDKMLHTILPHRTVNPAAFFGRRYAFPYRVDDLYRHVAQGAEFPLVAYQVGGGGTGVFESEIPDEAVVENSDVFPTVCCGVHKVGPTGKVRFPVDLPEASGAVRFVAVAWSQSRLGSSWQDSVALPDVSVAWCGAQRMVLGDNPVVYLSVRNHTKHKLVCTVRVEAPLGVCASLEKECTLEAGQEERIPVMVHTGKVLQEDVRVLVRHALACGENLVQKTFPVSVEAQKVSRRLFWPGRLDASMEDDSCFSGVDFSRPVDVFQSQSPIFVEGKNVFDDCGYQMPDILPYVASGYTALAQGDPVTSEVLDLISGVHRGAHRGQHGWYLPYLYAYDFVWHMQKNPKLSPHKDRMQDFLSLVGDMLLNVSIYAKRDLAHRLYIWAKTTQTTLQNIRYEAHFLGEKTRDPLVLVYCGGAFAHMGFAKEAERLWSKARTLLENMMKGYPRLYYRNLSSLWNPSEGTMVHDLSVFVHTVSEATQHYERMDDLLALLHRAQRRHPYLNAWECLSLLQAQVSLQTSVQAVHHHVVKVSGKQELYKALRALNKGHGLWYTVMAHGSGEAMAGKVTRTVYRLDGKKADLKRVKVGDKLYVVVRVERGEGLPLHTYSLEARIPGGCSLVGSGLLDVVPVALRKDLSFLTTGSSAKVVPGGVYMIDETWGRHATLCFPIVVRFPGVYTFPGVIFGDEGKMDLVHVGAPDVMHVAAS